MNYPAIKEKTHKIVHDAEALALHTKYQLTRNLREKDHANGALERAWNEIRSAYPDEWLLHLEILELIRKSERPAFYSEVLDHLLSLKNNADFTKMIEDGLSLLERD